MPRRSSNTRTSKTRASKPRDQTRSDTSGQVRIIGGQWRSRKIEVPIAEGLRPTGDRIRETLFNWLQQEVIGARCLDLFAGSGILGLEALSRGAEFCRFIETHESTCSALLTQLSKFDLSPDQATVTRTDASQWLKTPQIQESARYDLVFVDPPFAHDQAAEYCQQLEASSVMTDNALIYLEVELGQSDIELPERWRQLRSKSSGRVTYSLYQRELSQ